MSHALEIKLQYRQITVIIVDHEVSLSTKPILKHVEPLSALSAQGDLQVYYVAAIVLWLLLYYTHSLSIEYLY